MSTLWLQRKEAEHAIRLARLLASSKIAGHEREFETMLATEVGKLVAQGFCRDVATEKILRKYE